MSCSTLPRVSGCLLTCTPLAFSLFAPLLFVGSSSDSLACSVSFLFIPIVWCLACTEYLYLLTGFRSRLFLADDGAGSVPPPSQFQFWRYRHHLSPTVHTTMLCARYLPDSSHNFSNSISVMAKADVPLLLLLHRTRYTWHRISISSIFSSQTSNWSPNYSPFFVAVEECNHCHLTSAIISIV